MQKGEIGGPGAEGAPAETDPEAPASFRKVQLRLLMKEREGVVSRLVELDYTVWTLKFFMAGIP